MGADRIIAGNLSSAGTNPFDQQAIIQDIQNGVLSISGTSRRIVALRAMLLGLAAQTALTAITVAQNLFTYPVAAGFLNIVGRRLKVSFTLIYSTTAGQVATLGFALKLGSVTLCSIVTAATNTAASTNLPVHVEFSIAIASLGASGTIESHGRVEANIGTAAAAAVAVYLDTQAVVSAAVNLTAAQTLAVTLTGGGGAVPSAQIRDATIEVVA